MRCPFALILFIACAEPEPASTPDVGASDAGTRDGAAFDSGGRPDGGVALDAGAEDAGLGDASPGQDATPGAFSLRGQGFVTARDDTSDENFRLLEAGFERGERRCAGSYCLVGEVIQ